MKLAIAFIVLGAATLVALFLPVTAGGPAWLGVAWETRRINAVLLVLGAGAPVAMGLWALAHRPLLRWQAIAAAGGFGVVFLKVQVYRGLTRVLSAPASMQVLAVAVLAGLVVAVTAIVIAPDS
jgi:hypothetical protein